MSYRGRKLPYGRQTFFATQAVLELLLGGTIFDHQNVYVVGRDRKSTRLNSSHANISYAVFCLIKMKMPLMSLILIARINPLIRSLHYLFVCVSLSLPCVLLSPRLLMPFILDLNGTLLPTIQSS